MSVEIGAGSTTSLGRVLAHPFSNMRVNAISNILVCFIVTPFLFKSF
jgi:hypothetical protein